jgi:hypothetical protein
MTATPAPPHPCESSDDGLQYEAVEAAHQSATRSVEA